MDSISSKLLIGSLSFGSAEARTAARFRSRWMARRSRQHAGFRYRCRPYSRQPSSCSTQRNSRLKISPGVDSEIDVGCACALVILRYLGPKYA